MRGGAQETFDGMTPWQKLGQPMVFYLDDEDEIRGPARRIAESSIACGSDYGPQTLQPDRSRMSCRRSRQRSSAVDGRRPAMVYSVNEEDVEVAGAATTILR